MPRGQNQFGENNPAYVHGLHRHPLYGVHHQMMRRCYDPTHDRYVDYGGRGIRVHEPWHELAVYVTYVEEVLGPKRVATWTIDRIENDADYQPGNLRWATRSEQNANQRLRTMAGYPIGSSGYRGVALHKKSGLWRARFRDKSLGYFKTPEEAAHRYDDAVREALGERGERQMNFKEKP